MVLLIDNYDSFTYNVFQQIGKYEKVIVKKNDEISITQINKLNPSKIIISPGPKRPENAGISKEVIKNFYKTKPILGVCLGHQAIGQVFGVRVVQAKKIMHGKTSNVLHDQKSIFNNCENPMQVARYHSLAIEKAPKDFSVLATAKDGEIMAIKHKQFPLFGIQFHPESFMTKSGDALIKNFLRIADEFNNT